MKVSKTILFLFFFLLPLIGSSAETLTDTIVLRENAFSRSTELFLASIPLTLSYSILSYKFYKMYSENDASYSFSKKETANVIYVGISISLFYALFDMIFPKKEENDTKVYKERIKD